MPEVGFELDPITVQLTRSQVVRYSGASTDFNEIHFSDRHAQAIGLPGVVAHGMWTMGAALRIVTDWVGDPSRVLRYQVRFTKPVIVPDTDSGIEVRFAAKVTAVTDEVATLAITAETNDGAVLGAARAEVRLV